MQHVWENSKHTVIVYKSNKKFFCTESPSTPSLEASDPQQPQYSNNHQNLPSPVQQDVISCHMLQDVSSPVEQSLSSIACSEGIVVMENCSNSGLCLEVEHVNDVLETENQFSNSLVAGNQFGADCCVKTRNRYQEDGRNEVENQNISLMRSLQLYDDEGWLNYYMIHLRRTR